jgi:hypothetical protein
MNLVSQIFLSIGGIGFIIAVILLHIIIDGSKKNRK